MAKKICERPRVGDSWSRTNKDRDKIRVQDLDIYEEEDGSISMDTDEGENKRSMSRRRYGNKELNENLSPLYRFVDSQVNRPWDKVYSEIRKHIRTTSATQLHILQHLDFYVEGQNNEIYEENGRIYYHESKWGGGQRELRLGDLYVHPRTNLLRRYNKKNNNKPPPQNKKKVIKINEHTFFCLMDGAWYEITYKKLPKEEHFLIDHRNRSWLGHPDYLKKKVFNYVTQKAEKNPNSEYTKRQLSKDVLRKYDLQNDKGK